MKRKKPQTWNSDLARDLMIAKNLTRESVAKLIGMTEPSFTQNLNGRKPSLQTVKLLAHVLGCAEKDLLNPPARGRAAS